MVQNNPRKPNRLLTVDTCHVFFFRSYFGNKNMHNYQLREIVETARNLTSAKNDNEKSFSRFKYRVDLTNEVNWDSFKFEYVTNKPLSQVKLISITVITTSNTILFVNQSQPFLYRCSVLVVITTLTYLNFYGI